MTFTPRTLEELQAEWPAGLDHISASSVKMAARCPEQWRQRYVLGKKQAPAAALLMGRSNHAAIERSMVQKIETQNDLPVGEVRDFFLSHFEQAIESSGGIAEIEVQKADTLVAKRKTIDKMKVDGQRDVANYHGKVSPNIWPSAIEEEFTLSLPDLPVKVIGYIDLVARHGDELVIIDRKGSGRAKYKPEPEWVIQAEVYQLAHPLPHEWHVTNTSNGALILPSAYQDLVLPVVDQHRAITSLQHIVGEIGHYMRTYGPDGEWPTRGKQHTWACNFCGYRNDCWGWK